MHSTMIGKIEKAKRYAQEPGRFTFDEFRVRLEGDNRDHVVEYHFGTWGCDCETFAHNAYCPHTMAMERVLGEMIAPVAAETGENA